jgi:integrase/DNA-binding transcriptional regulator YhcF (GntR family)
VDIDPKHAFEKLAVELRDRIYAGDLAIGLPIPSAKELAREHGMSSSTAQRAVQLLSQWGLVRIEPGLPTLVTPRTAELSIVPTEAPPQSADKAIAPQPLELEVRSLATRYHRCSLPHCDLLAEDADPYCRVHALRWRNDGCRAHAEFEAVVMNYGDPRWDFRRLPAQLKLELQYGLQCSSELGHGKSAHSVGYLTRLLLRIGATTLLDRTRADWQAVFRQQWPNPKHGATSYVFLGFVIEELADLLDGHGWANEYPRDLWQLHRLGYTAASASRQLNFTDIGQRWLVETAKRWLHWRLTVEEKSVNTVLADLLALRRLSTFLSSTGQAQYSIRRLTRPVIEQYVASLHEQVEIAASTIRDNISAIAVFLRALQDHEDWAPDLPRKAVIYSSDYPRMDPLRARGLNTHVMTQVRAHLPDWPHPDGRFLTELMIATGLRLGDACELGYDPLVFDDDANPYIRCWNHKMRREAYVPISTALLDRIQAQQQRTSQRFPDSTAGYLAAPEPRTLPPAGLKLAPRTSRNPDGTRPFARGTYQQQLRIFQTTAQITDEAGRPVAITAHRWRHTFATALINRGVRLEVVKQLLDHASLEMSSHYARLLDTTIRSEWEAGRGPDDDYGHLLPTDVEWANQARTALPNGQCGLPRQQSCDHSNKCLPCPVFITTSQDLPAHEDQRRRTLTLIDQFNHAGQTKLADQNRLVLDQLDFRIEQIKKGMASKAAHHAGLTRLGARRSGTTTPPTSHDQHAARLARSREIRRAGHVRQDRRCRRRQPLLAIHPAGNPRGRRPTPRSQ